MFDYEQEKIHLMQQIQLYKKNQETAIDKHSYNSVIDNLNQELEQVEERIGEERRRNQN